MTDFLDLYQNNLGLSAEQKRELVDLLPNDIMFDTTFAKSQVSPSDLINLLENFGPFWVTLDADPSNRRNPHAVVVSGVSDTSAENAEVAYYDVASGQIEHSNFTDFIERVKDGNTDLEECLIRRVNKIGEGTKNAVPETYTIPAGKDVYILVAAFNYSTRKYSFSSYATAYRNKIIAANSSQTNVFIMIDFAGSIKYYENNTLKAQKNYETIGSVNYPYTDNKDFYFNQKTGYITKNTIYDLIIAIGTSNPGQLKDVSIFSHAYYAGPILVNTYEVGSSEYDDYKLDDTNYEDVDFRKDDVTNIDATKFKAAFSSNGMVKIWGCNSDAHINYFVKKILASPTYKSDGSTLDTAIFTINDATYYGTKVSSRFSAFINSVTGNQITISMLNVKKLFAFEYVDSFAAVLAEKTDVTVQSALPGTYASIGDAQTGEPASNKNIFRISHDTKMNVKIYTQYLTINLGELNYGLYTKAKVTHCKSI